MTPAHPLSSPRPALLGGALLLVLTALLVCLDLPFSHLDDGFFLGAAINLAEHGQLANPWIGEWRNHFSHPAGDAFYFHPGLYPALVAGWLKLWGISTPAILALAAGAVILASLLIWHLLRRVGTTVPAAMLGAGLTGLLLLERGLRPDASARVLLLAHVLLLFRAPGFSTGVLAGLLGSAAVLMHPLTSAYVVPATLLAGWWRRDQPGSIRSAALGVGVAVGGAVLLTVMAYGSNFYRFLATLLSHADFVRGEGGLLPTFKAALLVGHEGLPRLLALALVLLALATARPDRRRYVRQALLAVTSCAVLLIGLYPGPAALEVTVLLALAVLPLNPGATGWSRLLPLLPAAILAGWSSGQFCLQIMANRIQVPTITHREALAYLDEARPDILVFDAHTLRHVFAYRVPGPALDLGWASCPTSPPRWNTPALIYGRDLWIVNPRVARVAPQAAASNLTWLGHRFNSVGSQLSAVVVAGDQLPDLPLPAFVRAASLPAPGAPARPH